MARYRKVDPRMWGDLKFRSLSHAAQRVWFYLLTCPESTSLPGLIPIGELGLSEKVGLPMEAFREAFREALAKGMAEADWRAGVVWLPRACKYNRPESPNVVKSWRDHWDNIPECALKTKAYWVLKAFAEGLGEGYGKAFAKACGKAMPNPEPEQEPDPEPEKLHDPATTTKRPTTTPTKQPTWARELWSEHNKLNEKQKQAVFLSPTTAIQDYLDSLPEGVDPTTYAEQLKKLLAHAYSGDCRPWFVGKQESPMWSQCLEPKKFLRRVPEIQASLAAAGPPRRIIAGRNYR